jgi:taurine dioxygenase
MLLKTEPLNEHFGAEILGLDLRDAMTPEIEQTIKKLFLTHQLLYFRGQDLSPDDHVRFGKIFGELQIHVMNQYHESEHPELYRLSNIGEDGKPNGKFPDKGTHAWHTDASWQPLTGGATIIFCERATTRGGETHFCDMYRAYDRLPSMWIHRLDGKRAAHSLDFSRNRRHGEQPMTEKQKKSTPSVDHPIIRTHPDTKKKTIFLGDHAEHIVGMNYETGRLWIEELNNELIIHEDLTYRHKWAIGDLLVWDNRCLLHKVTAYDATTEGRTIRRCTTLDPRKPE